MAPTDPGTQASASTVVEPAGPTSGQEPLTADLRTRSPRVSTRTLVVAVALLAVLVLAAAAVALVVLHQPRLTPLPVPSVSSIA